MFVIVGGGSHFTASARSELPGRRAWSIVEWGEISALSSPQALVAGARGFSKKRFTQSAVVGFTRRGIPPGILHVSWTDETR